MSLDIVFPEGSKECVEVQCNSVLALYTDPAEIPRAEKFLVDLNPKNVLELGAGIGRMSVCFNKYFGWDDTNFHLYDGHSEKLYQYQGMRKCPDKPEVYNRLDVTKEFCLANGISEDRLHVIDLAKMSLADIGVKFDLCYSWKSIGSHWPISMYLDQLAEVMLPDGLVLFELRELITDKHKAFNQKQLDSIPKDKFKIVDYVTNLVVNKYITNKVSYYPTVLVLRRLK